MDSAASRILKARQYAMERDQRVRVHSFEVELHGDRHLLDPQRLVQRPLGLVDRDGDRT